MSIEKVFAIAAEPAQIWDALWADLGSGDPDSFRVEGSRWPHTLSVRVSLGGLASLLTYTIDSKGDYCEVAATLQPLSVRYALYQVLTLGRMRTNYELVLVEGLANLKQALEGQELPVPDGDDEQMAGDAG